MANRSYALLFLALLCSSFLSACGGGGFGGNNGGDGNGVPSANPPNDCRSPTPFDGYNTSLPADNQNGEISTSYTLTSGCYLVEKQLLVTGNATLTIEPRTTLLFAPTGGLTANGGNIIASGTASAPIYFTSQLKQPGAWIGIRIARRSYGFNQPVINPSIFNHVVIEYAGNTGFDVSRPTYSFGVINIRGDQGVGRVSLLNSTIRYGAGQYALYAEAMSYFEQIQNNLIYGNQGYPVQIHSNAVHFLENSNRFSVQGEDNFINKVYVVGDRIDTFRSEETFNTSRITWQNLQIPYLITNDIQVFNTELTIEPGTTLEFGENAGIIISQPASALIANGTASRPITFSLDSTEIVESGIQKVFWKGLRFANNANNVLNLLNYVTMEYGGNVVDRNTKANLVVDDNSQVNISNSRFRLSGGYGILLEADSVVPQFDNNSLALNQISSALVSSKAVRFLNNSNQFDSYIEVKPEGLNGGDVWQGLNAPYAFFSFFSIDKKLTIEAGATLIFEENTALEVNGPFSGLVVNGTAQQPVTFTSLSDYFSNSFGIKYWQGIIFRNSPGIPTNVIEHAIIKYAGSGNITSNNQPPAAIRLYSVNNQTRLVMRNTSIDLLHTDAKSLFVDEDSSFIQDSGSNNGTLDICYWRGGMCNSF